MGGKRARDKKERLLLFRGQMNSNKNLRGMWGKRSGENSNLKQPVAEFWRNWRNSDKKRGPLKGESWLSLRGSGNSGMWGKRTQGLEDHHTGGASEDFYYEE